MTERELERLAQRGLLLRHCTARAMTIDEGGRSVEAVIATETPTAVYDWARDEVIDEVLLMEGAQLPESRQLPLLDSHARWSTGDVIGSTRALRIEGGQLIGRNVFSALAEDAWTKVREGHISDNSISYRVTQGVMIAAGQSTQVQGRTYTAGVRPLRVATEWRPVENSLVPIGADTLAKMRHESGAATARRDEEISVTKRNTQAPESGPAPDPQDTPPAAIPSPPDTPPPPAAEAAPAAAARSGADSAGGDSAGRIARAEQEAVARERARAAEIRRLAADVDPTLGQRAIDGGWSIEATRAALLEHLTGQRAAAGGSAGHSAPAGHVRSGVYDSDALAAGLLHRLGVDPSQVLAQRGMQRSADEAARRQAAARWAEQGWSLRDCSAVDLCRHILRIAGVEAPAGRREMVRSAFSTTAFQGVFTTSAQALLLQSYESAPDVTAGWVSEKMVPNFKTNERTRLGLAGPLAKKVRGQAAEHLTLSDATESYKAARYARQFVVDDQDMLDDSLDALQTAPQIMGLLARNLRPELVFAVLLNNAALNADSIALFHASHNNLDSGAGSALSAAALKVALAAMAAQRQNGQPLNLRGRYLIVPPDLEFTALQLVQSIEVRNTGDAAGTEFGTANVLRGRCEVRVAPYIDATGFTDPDTRATLAGSATNWYLMAAAPWAPIEVGYVAGTGNQPQISSYALTDGQIGMGWTMWMDLGAKALDYRGAYSSAGA